MKAQANKVKYGKHADAARAKWEELDRDANGWLEGEEIRELAAWVWQGFRPGREITEEENDKEASKILKLTHAVGPKGYGKDGP